MATSHHDPQGNLKDRIAALQQRNVTPDPSSAPSSFKSDNAPVSPPRGSLRDKIAKFERKGGVPIPRGSFGMGAPPPEVPTSIKSRELYGNRVAALGKGRPGTVSPQGRAVTSPTSTEEAIKRHVSSPSLSLFEGAELVPSDSLQPLSPHITGSSVPPSPSPSPSLSTPSRRGSAIIPSRRLSVIDIAEHYESLPTTPTRTARPLPSPVRSPEIVVVENGDVGDAVAAVDVVSHVTSEAVSPSPVNPVSVASVATPTPPTTASSEKLVKTASVAEPTVTEPAELLDSPTPDIDGALAPSPLNTTVLPPQSASPSPVASSPDTLSPSPSTPASAEPEAPKSTLALDTDMQILTGTRTTISPTESRPTPIARTMSPALSVAAPLSHFEEPSLSPAAQTARKTFTAVVHSKHSDSQPAESRSSTASRSSTIKSRPGSSSTKTSIDLAHSHTVLRSKRQFKHLSNTVVDPPASPGATDLAALLREATWMEERLADGNTTFGPPSVSDSEADQEPDFVRSPVIQKSSSRSFPVLQTPQRATAADAARLSIVPPSFSSTPTLQLTAPATQLTSTSTPTLQVHAPASSAEDDTPPTPPPKSARTRRYFSLRSLRAPSAYPRHSVSSEMSSDDSAPVATPPSPSSTFDLGSSGLRSSETGSVRSGWSSRSGSGKSESLKLSPRRGVARAASFAERLLNRSSKTRSIAEDDIIPEMPPTLPSPIPETPHSVLSLSTSSSSIGSPDNTISFDRDIFDAFPSVPQQVPSRPPTYVLPMPTTPPKAHHSVSRSTTAPMLPSIEVKSSALDTSELDLSWLRQGSDDADAWLRLQSGNDL